VARDTVSKTRMMIQLTLMSMSIPAILPIRNEPGMVILLPIDVYVRTPTHTADPQLLRYALPQQTKEISDVIPATIIR
jgi:hypothetical protein